LRNRLGSPSNLQRHRFRPECENLEDRTVPAVFNPVDAPSLIAAVASANTTPGGNTINLVAGMTYSLTADQGGGNGLQTIAAAGGTLTVNGNGATINRGVGAANIRFFNIAVGANVILNSVTLSGGASNAAPGGAVYAAGNLTANNCTFSGNQTTGSNGQARGGAIRVVTGATVTLNSSVLSGNTATWGGSILNYGTLVANDTTFSGNKTITYGGGAITS